MDVNKIYNNTVLKIKNRHLYTEFYYITELMNTNNDINKILEDAETNRKVINIDFSNFVDITHSMNDTTIENTYVDVTKSAVKDGFYRFIKTDDKFYKRYYRYYEFDFRHYNCIIDRDGKRCVKYVSNDSSGYMIISMINLLLSVSYVLDFLSNGRQEGNPTAKEMEEKSNNLKILRDISNCKSVRYYDIDDGFRYIIKEE